MPTFHPKVKVPAAVLGALSLVSVAVTAIAGTDTLPWATAVAGGVATVLQLVTGYLTSS